MKGKKYGSEQIIPILREAASGKTVAEICREHNISEVTFHRWKKKYGHLDIQDAKRLKELERENTELKKMLADQLLQIRVLEVACEKKL